MRALLLSTICFLFTSVIPAQVQPGLYLCHKSFDANKPEVSLDSVDFDWYFSEEDGYARGTIRQHGRKVIEPVIVCFPTACFILDSGRKEMEVSYYTRLVETGSICLYRLLRVEMEWVPMKAYNPANGRPFLEGRVPRTREVAEWHLWRPSNNAFSPLNKVTYAEWTGFEVEGPIREQEMIQGIRTYNQIMSKRYSNQ